MKDIADIDIRTLRDGEKISEPGFYNIPLEVHHSQCCDGPSVTSSGLRTIEKATPADFWAFSDWNDDRWEKEETTALRLGRAMALYIEGGPDGLEDGFRVLPEDRPTRPSDDLMVEYGKLKITDFVEKPSDAPRRPNEAQIEAVKAGQGTDAAIRSVHYWGKLTEGGKKTAVTSSEYAQLEKRVAAYKFWKGVADDPRDLITEAEWELLCNMGKVLKADPAAQAALGGIPELTMAWFDEETRIWCLSRPDQVAFTGMLSDYKKFSGQGLPILPHLVDARITRYGYDMQMGFAVEGFEVLTGHWPDTVGLVFQSDKPPHHVILRPLAEEDIRMGMFLNREALHTVRACIDNGHWWGPGEHIEPYQRPEWQREQLLKRMKTAGVAP